MATVIWLTENIFKLAILRDSNLTIAFLSSYRTFREDTELFQNGMTVLDSTGQINIPQDTPLCVCIVASFRFTLKNNWTRQTHNNSFAQSTNETKWCLSFVIHRHASPMQRHRRTIDSTPHIHMVRVKMKNVQVLLIVSLPHKGRRSCWEDYR